MKGRRKVRTEKWQMIEQFKREARAFVASEEHAQRAGRFLSRSANAGREGEPVGVMAGKR